MSEQSNDSNTDAYSIDVQRAYDYLIFRLSREELLSDVIGQVRGSYGQAVANSVQDKISNVLLKSEEKSNV